MYRYGNKRLLKIKEFITILIGAPIVAVVLATVVGFFSPRWERTTFFVLLIFFGLGGVKAFVDLMKSDDKYRFIINQTGIEIDGKMNAWKDIKHIAGQVQDFDNYIVVKKHYHNVVAVQRKDGTTSTLVAENELIKGFDYDLFVKNLIQLGHIKLLIVKPKDQKRIDWLIKQYQHSQK